MRHYKKLDVTSCLHRRILRLYKPTGEVACNCQLTDDSELKTGGEQCELTQLL